MYICHAPARWMTALAAAAVLSPWASAQTVFAGQNFAGTNRAASGFIPPDTMGSVGRDHFVELINGRYATYRKSDGVRVQNTTLNAFFTAAGLTPTANAFDPRVIFDPHSNRWFAVAVDNAAAANRYLMAVSINSDPTAGWRAFGIDADADNNRWADFPMLGMNGSNVVLSANMFGISGASTTTGMVVIDKAGLLTATPATAGRVSFEDIDPNSSGFTPQPVWDMDNDTSGSRTLSDYSTSAGVHRFSTINGTGAGASLSFAALVSVPGFSAPPTADQPGTKVNINTGDSRFSGNVVKNGNDIWAVQTVSVSGRAALRWSRYNATTQVVVASGTISDPALALFFPSLAVNDFGQIMIGFSTTSPAQNVAASYVVGTYGTGAATFGGIQNYQVGVSDYERLDGSGRNRWGDYSATNADATDPSIFWTIQEYVSATNEWTTRVGEFILPRPNEARWAQPVSGNFATGSNWFAGTAPAPDSDLVFSRSTTPGAAGYTVTFPTSDFPTHAALRVHQGAVTLAVPNGILTLTDATDSVILGQYAGTPKLTIAAGGTVNAPQVLISPSVLSNGSQLVVAGSLFATDVSVGGSPAAPGGTGSLATTGNLSVSGRLRVYPGSTFTATAGSLTLSGSFDILGVATVSAPITVLGDVTGTGQLFLTNGLHFAGSLVLDTLSISAASLSVAAGGPAIQLKSLTNTGTFNTNDNDLLIDYTGASPIASLIAQLNSGRLVPLADFAGLPTTLAISEASDLGFTNFSGVDIDSSTVIAKFTYVGDANLDGQVDALDYERVDLAIGNTGVLGTAQGDLNYDGNVDALDYEQIDLNIGNGVGAPLGTVFIPEPVAVVPALLAAAMIARRRR